MTTSQILDAVKEIHTAADAKRFLMTIPKPRQAIAAAIAMAAPEEAARISLVFLS